MTSREPLRFWERIGEAIGYALAAVVLGPPAALSRTERRKVRRAFAVWCEELGAVKLAGAPGVLRRSVTMKSAIGATPAEVELDLHARRARIHMVIPPLPSWVRAKVQCEHALRVHSDTLDRDALRALGDHVISGKLGQLRTIEIDIQSEHLDVVVIAMTKVDAWRAIGEGVVALANWLAQRWPVGYRG